MKTIKVVAALLLPGLLWAGTVPPTITYQGTIKQQGIPVNDTLPMSFRLTNSDGTQVYWSGAVTSIAVNQGMFSSVLSPTGVDWQNVTPYIEMSVNGQTLLPREPLGTGAYAFMSNAVVDGSITTASLAAAAVTTANIANGAVTSQQIAAGAVTTAQLAAGSVTTAQLDPSVQLITVPSGMISMFASSCPNGWSRFSALDNAFPMGSASYGTTGGSATLATGRGVVFGSGQGSGSFQTSWINGDLTLQNMSVSILPPYVTVVYCIKS